MNSLFTITVLATVILLVLKLANVVTISYWLVFSPILAYLCLAFVLFALVGFVIVLLVALDKAKKK